MITQYLGFWISCTEGCGGNAGGYCCRIYTDEGLEQEIDNFCIQAGEFADEDDVDNLIREKIRDSFDEYMVDPQVWTLIRSRLPVTEGLPKRLMAFYWHFEHLNDNASDELILTAHILQDHPEHRVVCCTPEEFAETLNNEQYSDCYCYLRFIEIDAEPRPTVVS